jgi:phosphoribosylanthranilate isomerase
MLVKVCGITRVEDARLAVALGATSIGINLVPSSKRVVSAEVAAEIVRAVHDAGALAIGVVADRALTDMTDLQDRLRFDFLQLHGDEPPDVVRALPRAYKALRIGAPDDVAVATRFPGDVVLVDARVDGQLGGTGATFDWALVRQLCRTRRVILAGGLTPDNVAHAIAVAAPFAVDVASGVEGADPRVKDPDKMRRFIARARAVNKPD